MSSPIFHIYEHAVPTCHIREYPRATASGQDEILHLAVKQYVPKESVGTAKGSVTIIGAHANGFPKELYEPLWEDLYQRLKSHGIHIRSVWIADVAQQGASGVLNERQLGNDPSWFDHPRDLFLMVNHFREHMKRPIIGVGHSMGGNHLVNLALMHPRLFTSLILIDPVVARFHSVKGNYNPAKASTARRDLWPSRRAAAEKMSQSKFYKTWDKRVFDRWIQYGLRELPTYLHPRVTAASATPPTITPDTGLATVSPAQNTEREVTLTTTKHQEVLTFMRPNFANSEFPNPTIQPNRITHIDVDASKGPQSPFYRSEGMSTFHRLPFLRPSVFYIFGDPSLADLSVPVLKADKLAHTGTAIGGSGGVKEGRVSSVTFDGVGHLIPMEAVDRTAVAATSWILPEVARWQELETQASSTWTAVPKEQKAQMSPEYIRIMMTDWVTDGWEKFRQESKL